MFKRLLSLTVGGLLLLGAMEAMAKGPGAGAGGGMGQGQMYRYQGGKQSNGQAIKQQDQIRQQDQLRQQDQQRQQKRDRIRDPQTHQTPTPSTTQ